MGALVEILRLTPLCLGKTKTVSSLRRLTALRIDQVEEELERMNS